MKRLFFSSVLFFVLVLPSVGKELSYTAGPNAATPHYVNCSACQQNFWRCTEASSHALQASCSTTNGDGQSCTVTNFYACQSHTHEYPSTGLMPCPGTGIWVCTKGGFMKNVIDDELFEHETSCEMGQACQAGVVYWACDPAMVAFHEERTCTRCSQTYRVCANTATSCQGHQKHTDAPIAVVNLNGDSTNGGNSENGDSTNGNSENNRKSNPPLTTSTNTGNANDDTDDTTADTDDDNADDDASVPEAPPKKPSRPTAVCGSGHTYYTDVSYARHRHRDRTCTRCSQTYQNCSNHSSACQGSRWHTEDPSATPKPPTTTPTPPPTTPSTSPNSDDDDDDDTSVPVAPSKPVVSYRPCGHLTTAEGDHSQQASCSETNGRGDTCTVASFYACQSHTHQYPAPPKNPDPPPPPSVACPADSWTSCGGTTSHASTCSAGHSYYTCASQAWHKDRTCTRCSQTYQDCTNSASACQSNHWHTDQAIRCGASSWTGCTTSVSSSTEHRRTCRENHQYWTCGTAEEWHKTRTCTRCGWAYSNCGNSATACQGKRWHTGG